MRIELNEIVTKEREKTVSARNVGHNLVHLLAVWENVTEQISITMKLSNGWIQNRIFGAPSLNKTNWERHKSVPRLMVKMRKSTSKP